MSPFLEASYKKATAEADLPWPFIQPRPGGKLANELKWGDFSSGRYLLIPLRAFLRGYLNYILSSRVNLAPLKICNRNKPRPKGYPR